ncbi:MAG TPA: GTP cyclohydrolase I FolE [Mycobacteriales bacterium]|jgi:GTP cyclohydrolase I|nr:GTP cyclohydrolase I FolE [Mycobacteriales bacterium]
MTAEIAPSPLRAVGRATVDVDAAAAAVEDLMRALGMDVNDPTLRRTPSRVANAFAEMLAPREFGLTTFPNEENYDELVVARDIPFTSICEHHLLPFTGTAAVGYLPGNRILGLSKLARVVELFSRRPQVQERLTKQVATWLDDHLNPRGVGVVMTAEHSCMTLRGVRAQGSSTVTSALLGVLRDDPRTRAEFLSLATTRSTQ